MTLDVKRYERKPVEVTAVKVDKLNMAEVAEWCSGEIVGEGKNRHIEVRTTFPRNKRQSQAYAGDYVLYGKSGYKVYQGKSFRNHFLEVDPLVPVHPEQQTLGWIAPIDEDSVVTRQHEEWQALRQQVAENALDRVSTQAEQIQQFEELTGLKVILINHETLRNAPAIVTAIQNEEVST